MDPQSVFVCYRRVDSADVAGRIYDRLVQQFGRDQVFKDVDSIPIGVDFRKTLDEKVGRCSVFLAIIGRRWLEAKETHGDRALDDPTDFVRIEIESALRREIPVVPVLVHEASIPLEADLPDGVQQLVYRQGIPVRSDPDFHRDMDRLIAGLQRVLEEEAPKAEEARKEDQARKQREALKTDKARKAGAGRKQVTTAESDRKRALKRIEKQGNTAFACSACGFPVSYDRVTGGGMVMLVGVVIAGGIVGFLLGYWVGAIIGSLLAAAVAFILGLSDALSEPSACPSCGVELKKPLAKYG